MQGPSRDKHVCAHACRGSAGKLVDLDTISKADHNGHTGSHSPSRNHPPTQQSNHSKSQSHSKTPTAHQWVPWQSAASASVPVSLRRTRGCNTRRKGLSRSQSHRRHCWPRSQSQRMQRWSRSQRQALQTFTHKLSQGKKKKCAKPVLNYCIALNYCMTNALYCVLLHCIAVPCITFCYLEWFDFDAVYQQHQACEYRRNHGQFPNSEFLLYSGYMPLLALHTVFYKERVRRAESNVLPVPALRTNNRPLIA